MKTLKNFWHRLHFWRALWKLKRSSDPVLRRLVKGKALQPIFVGASQRFSAVTNLPHEIISENEFRKVSIAGLVIFWPEAASMRALWMVLAEILLPEHPHYYDSEPSPVQQGDVVLDIGACEGAFALSAARKAAQVVAVEPSRVMQKALSKSAESMKLANFKCVEVLLGPEQAQVGFFDDTLNPLNGRVVPLTQCSYPMQCMTLDEFCNKYAPDGIDYIKCDAEGQDVGVISSGLQTLRRWRPRIAVATYHAPEDFNKLRNILEGIGYEVSAQGLHYDPVNHSCYPILLKARAKATTTQTS